jgi:hypothetical protein
VPVERPPFVGQRFKLHHFIRAVVDLAMVSIHDRNNVVKFMMPCAHHRFPDLTFVQLPIPMKYIDMVCLFI